ncbi:MAG: queuosine precursor transporter, partial [Candidatus Competibacteraceae bacterium]|nr:queuosine precursor transporter [Candidatus Competibacteraceae bacterium]
VWLFARLKQLTGGRYLWLRNNGSTIVSQLLDSTVFIVIAFAGVFPLLPMIFGQWLIKLVIALADTPLVYGGVYLLRRKHKHYAAI